MSEEVDDRKAAYVVGGILLFAILMAVVVLYYLPNGATANNAVAAAYTPKVQAWLKEANIQMNVSDCMPNPSLGYICTVTSQVKIPDLNIDANYYASAPVLVYRDENSVVLVKIDPATNMDLKPVKVDNTIKQILKPLTIVKPEYMYCVSMSNNSYKCYIPTNMAPLGKGTLYYAPLFEIHRDNNTWIVTVKV